MWMRCCTILEYAHANAAMYVPIELDMEASDGKLEGVKILERVESQPSYRGGTGQGLEQLCQRIGNIRLGSTAVDCNSHVLLSFPEKCEFGGTIDRKANEQFTGT
jgi:hypothetical protein